MNELNEMSQVPPTLYVVDASAFIFRNFYGMRERLSTVTGEPVQAVFGYMRTLIKLLRERQPTHLAVAFDSPGPTFRNEIYPEYKANRDAPPPSLPEQYELCVEGTRAMGIKSFSVSSLEADDIIGTLVRMWETQTGGECVMLASDKDLMQLINPRVRMWDGKERERGPDQVIEKFGVRADQVIDVLGLAGDSSDNIPGVPGIGIKTAAKLLNDYNTLEELLERAGEIKGKRGENLRAFGDQARLSARLATIKCDADLEEDISDLHHTLTYRGPRLEEVDIFLDRLGFERFKRDLRTGPIPIYTPSAEVQAQSSTSALDETTTQSALQTSSQAAVEAAVGSPVERASPQPAQTQAPVKSTHPAISAAESPVIVDRDRYRCLLSEGDLQEVIKEIREAGILSVDLETTSLSAHRAKILGIALAWGENQAAYVPLDHFYLGVPAQIPSDRVWSLLAPLLSDPQLPKVAQNHKYDHKVFTQRGIECVGWRGDPMLIAYLLDPSRMSFGLDALSKDLLNHTNLTFKEVAGKSGDEDRFQLVDVHRATQYAAEDADVTLRLYQLLWPQLEREPELLRLYEEVELPLSQVLASMEMTGIQLDTQQLNAQSEELLERILTLQEEVQTLAGERFNLDSPKQLSTILFEKLGLETKGMKKRTSKGQLSTRQDLLEKLKGSHPIIDKILEYRHLAKLRNTYLEALPALIEPETTRLHTSFKQSGTATGRLSSSDPNLQNIPLRTSEGRRIREAFTTTPGWKLISADYSQVELRLLAHFAKATRLIQGFKDGVDIHAATAAEIFNITPAELTSDQRRSAKAINFGLMYGMGPKRLSESIGVSFKEAKEMITAYFARYGEVRAYFSSAVIEAELSESTKTLMGRRRLLTDINKSGRAKQQAERLAVNTPIQGTAADILKVAMVSLDAALRERKLRARLLLTVHDELVLEAPEDEVDEVVTLTRDHMEGAAQLSVPLAVEVGVGLNWAEIH